MCCASWRERTANFRRNRFCSRQSSRDSRTAEATRSPSACQSCKGTSLADRGAAEVTAATTESAASSQSTSTGRIFAALPSVNGMSASQISPGDGVIVKPFVRWRVAVQKSAVVADIVSLPLPVNPFDQFRKIFGRKLLDSAFDFLNCAHVGKLQPQSFAGKRELSLQNRRVAVEREGAGALDLHVHELPLMAGAAVKQHNAVATRAPGVARRVFLARPFHQNFHLPSDEGVIFARGDFVHQFQQTMIPFLADS